MEGFEMFPLERIVEVTDLVNASYYRLPENFAWSGESHDCWELVYVDQGTLIVTADSHVYEMKAGEVCFHCPNEFHNLHPFGVESANVVVIAFVGNGSALYSLKGRILTLGKTEKEYLTRIVSEAEAAFSYFRNDPPKVRLQLRENAPFGSSQVIRNLLECFLLMVQRHRDSIALEERSVPANQMHHHMRVAIEVQEYLNRHFREKITLEMLADMNHISVSHLKRVFREQTGHTVIASLIAVRMEEAKRLIQESTGTFSEIAGMVGYDNIYYFSNAFKRYTNMTLTEYSKSVLR